MGKDSLITCRYQKKYLIDNKVKSNREFHLNYCMNEVNINRGRINYLY